MTSEVNLPAQKFKCWVSYLNLLQVQMNWDWLGFVIYADRDFKELGRLSDFYCTKATTID